MIRISRLAPLLGLFLVACGGTGQHSRPLEIDDADAWRAICKDGTRVKAVREEGICDDHHGLAMWMNKPREAAMAEEATK
nr:hypothetical protein [Aeromonas rivuli]